MLNLRNQTGVVPVRAASPAAPPWAGEALTAHTVGLGESRRPSAFPEAEEGVQGTGGRFQLRGLSKGRQCVALSFC